MKIPRLTRYSCCLSFLVLGLSLAYGANAQETGSASSPIPRAANPEPADTDFGNPASGWLQFSLVVPPDVPLWDTGISLHSGDLVEISAPTTGSCRPSGTDHERMLQSLPVPSARFGALIARLGHHDPFAVGPRYLTEMQEAVPLFLGVNTDGEPACSGQYDVQVSIRPQVVDGAPTDDYTILVSHLDRLPRRVTDASGHPGDVVNFILIGSDPPIRTALSGVNWHVADERKLQAAVHAILASWAREDYLQMPMSKLYCFGRAQDFGYELAQPYKVAASRHHFRLWLAPWQFGGMEVWIGAATHDIGFTKDHRNGHLTHKIDPDIDNEREFILHTLAKEPKIESFYFSPTDPVRQSHNATGDPFHSDGRVLVLLLKTTADH